MASIRRAANTKSAGPTTPRPSTHLVWSGAKITSSRISIPGSWYVPDVVSSMSASSICFQSLTITQQVFFLKFNKLMWNRGGFSEKLVNNSALYNPWATTGRSNTPFDQPFYLILNVAVGGTNGFFPEGVGNKPWGNESPTVRLRHCCGNIR
jgi:hypothetical protein